MLIRRLGQFDGPHFIGFVFRQGGDTGNRTLPDIYQERKALCRVQRIERGADQHVGLVGRRVVQRAAAPAQLAGQAFCALGVAFRQGVVQHQGARHT